MIGYGVSMDRVKGVFDDLVGTYDDRAGVRSVSLISIIFIAQLASLCVWARSQEATTPAQSIPSAATEISADMGPCSVEFHVTDLAGDPLYNAEITTTISYGFMNKRKLNLQAGTNSDGRARFIRLPSQVKQPLQFHVQYKDVIAGYGIDPGTDCRAQRDVPLKTK